ncbi:MAG: pirin family protein [Deltaproteobacteria bacterium]|nr:pirin family protein [Deltaproteobacteria bacterium]
MEIQVRKAPERGHADHGWLKSFHTFSFADYYDPDHMGFRALRVINEDFIAPNAGFPTHAHRDMEILTYVLQGAIGHKDSMGNGSTIKPGEVQKMSAGTGVKHSEMNASRTEETHMLQIWIMPDRPGHAPSYDQRMFPTEDRRDHLRIVASPDGRDGSIQIHQDATLAATLLSPAKSVTHTLASDRHAWVQVARGKVDLAGQQLGAGDGAAIRGPGELTITGIEDAELLLFDLA